MGPSEELQEVFNRRRERIKYLVGQINTLRGFRSYLYNKCVYLLTRGERMIVARTKQSSDNDTLDKILRTIKWLNIKLRVEEHFLFFFSPLTFQ